MATSSEKPSSSNDPFSGGISTDLPRTSRLSGVVRLVVVVLVLGAGAYFFGPTVYSSLTSSDADEAVTVSTHRVTFSSLLVSVTEDGNVESAGNIDLKCQIEGGSSILWIVEDGTVVKKGDELVHLDQSIVEDKLNSQKIVYGNALTAKIQAERDVLVAEKSIEEYEKGTFKIEQQNADAQIKIAQENLRTSQNLLKFTEKMVRKGFATSLQFEADQFAVERSELELDSARTSKEVLEKYQKAKMLIDLQSQKATAEARLQSEEAALALEKARLDRLEGQIAFCMLKAPQDGMVVYANSSGRRSSPVVIEEGASVRERQNILRLPDLTRMQVKVNIHESRVEQIATGLPATIKIQGKIELKGKVVSVANQPESGSFFGANVKEYKTTVAIDGEQKDLKPGMTAEVTIAIAHLEDILSVPVQCVVEIGGKFYAWVKDPDPLGKPQQKEVVIGRTNDTFIEIKDGLKENDEVLLNPRSNITEANRQESIDERAAKIDAEGEKFKSALKERSENPNAQPKKKGSGSRRGGGGGGGGGQSGQRTGRTSGGGGGGFDMMARFDTDKDGKITRAELDSATNGNGGRMLERMDTNKDGAIDQAELDSRQRSGSGSGSGGAGRSGGGRSGGGRSGGGGGGGGGRREDR